MFRPRCPLHPALRDPSITISKQNREDSGEAGSSQRGAVAFALRSRSSVPELPDIVVYIECLEARILERPLARARLASAFLLRSVEPPLAQVEGRRVVGLRRLGKRIVLALDGDLFLVLHLMIAGRLRWSSRDAGIPRRGGLAAFDFPHGTLLLTEAGSRKRAGRFVSPRREVAIWRRNVTSSLGHPTMAQGPSGRRKACRTSHLEGLIRVWESFKIYQG